MSKLNRKEFLKAISLGSVTLTGGWHLLKGMTISDGLAGNTGKAAFLGTVPSRVNVAEWFSYLKSIGTGNYYFYDPHYRGRQFARLYDKKKNLENGGNDFKSVAMLSHTDSSFTPYINHENIVYQENLIQRAYDAALANKINFYYSFPFPLFPVQDIRIVRKLKPEYFTKSGQFNIYSPLLPVLLKKTIRIFKKRLPELTGVNMWLAEGSGEIYEYSQEDLIHNKEWIVPLLKAFDEICRELGLEAIVNIHNYRNTGKTFHQVYEVLSQFPDIAIMTNSTWPEENMLMPFDGYLNRQDIKLVERNRSLGMTLTDTEYLGQGTWPGVYTQWWKYNILEIKKQKNYDPIGRVFFYDKGKTDINFNRLNVYVFARLLNDPSANEKDVLTAAVQEMFGKDCPAGLVNLLYETEAIIKEIISIDYVSPLSHSGYPSASSLDADYVKGIYNMKAVNDLFEPAGTPLYKAFADEDDLNAGNYWRHERKIVSRPVENYLKSKEESINWLQKKLSEVDNLTKSLKPEHRQMFMSGYHRLYILAQGMKIFVEAADIHYDWYRAKKINKQEALRKSKPLAEDLRMLASQIGNDDPLNQRKRMEHFAKSIELLKSYKND